MSIYEHKSRSQVELNIDFVTVNLELNFISNSSYFIIGSAIKLDALVNTILFLLIFSLRHCQKSA